MTKHATHDDGLSAPQPWAGLMAWNGNFATALAEASAAYTQACLEWQQELVRFVGTRLDQDRQTQESLTDCHDLADLAKAQQDWATKATRDYLSEATRMTQLASQFAQIAIAPLFNAGRDARQESKATK